VAVLLIRADASEQMGTGHVMRCIALAQDWRDRLNGSVVFVAGHLPIALQNRLMNEGFTVCMIARARNDSTDAQAVVRLALLNEAQAVVVDGYQFSENYLRMIGGRGFVTMIIDDLARLRDYPVDFVVNPHPSAQADTYGNVETDATLLLGSRYMLLRREFLDPNRGVDSRRTARDRGESPRLLVTLGGADPDNLTGTVIEALKLLSGLSYCACVIVGAANPRRQQLVDAVSEAPQISVVDNVQNMAELFGKSDFAISGAGVSNWEMCYVGLPAMIMILADNQQENANYLDQSGVAHNLGPASQLCAAEIAAAVKTWLIHPELLDDYRQRADGLVDGQGARRCVNNLALYKAGWSPLIRRRTAVTGRILFRDADRADAALLLDWRNDPLTRAASRQTEAISVEDHAKWLVDTIAHTDRRLMVAEIDGEPVGTIRLDIDSFCELSWTVSPKARQRGVGRRMVEEMIQMLALPMRAVVRKTNLASRKIALACGFKCLSESHDWMTFERSPVKTEVELKGK